MIRTMKIIKFPNKVLKDRAQDVDLSNGLVSKDVTKLIGEMIETVKSHRALGLAAPQVGVGLRLIVCELAIGTTVMINPEAVPVGNSTYQMKEGCLSFPGVYNEVERPGQLEVKYFDINGLPQMECFSAQDAVIIQHEIDHLNGVMFIDRVGPLRNSLLQKYFKKNPL